MGVRYRHHHAVSFAWSALHRWGKHFVSFLPAISAKAAKKIRHTIRDWRMASKRWSITPNASCRPASVTDTARAETLLDRMSTRKLHQRPTGQGESVFPGV